MRIINYTYLFYVEQKTKAQSLPKRIPIDEI